MLHSDQADHLQTAVQHFSFFHFLAASLHGLFLLEAAAFLFSKDVLKKSFSIWM